MLLDKAIKERRSVRIFAEKEVTENQAKEILESGRWAPSSLNCQPWRFSIVKDRKTKQEIAKLVHHSAAIETASLCIAVFLSEEDIHDRTECLLSIGACIQNMLLKIHSLGLAGFCISDIKQKGKFNKALLVSPANEPIALVLAGYAGDNPKSDRKELKELIL